MFHICFSSSASGIIRRILRTRARNEAVCIFLDDLSVGPIADVCGLERKAWYLKYFAADMLETGQLWDDQIRFWSKTILSQDQLMVWLTRRSAAEYCGFLELLSLLPEKSEICLADFTEQKFSVDKANTMEASISLGHLNEENMETGFQIKSISKARELVPLIQMWKDLKSENAALRIVENNRLISKSEDYFDEFLFQQISDSWQRLYRVVGEAVVGSWENGHRVSFDWFNQRIKGLAKDGFVEIENYATSIERRIRLGPQGSGASPRRFFNQ